MKFVILRSRLIDDELKKYDADLLKEYDLILNGVADDSAFTIVSEKETGYDELVSGCNAYYGDGSHLAHMFRNAGKPVMIQNYDI